MRLGFISITSVTLCCTAVLGMNHGRIQAQMQPQAQAHAQLQTSKPLSERIDAVMAEHAPWARRDTPGCAVAITKQGELVHNKGYGLADVEHGVPITPDTVFDIGSTAKQFTAATVMLLAAEGKLSIDDDVRKYIPELAVYDEDKPITLLSLLNHTSGVRDYITLMRLGGFRFDDYLGSSDTLAMLARQKSLDFVTGEQWGYSNSGYFLLALSAERVAHKPFPSLVAERIFKPLGMTHTQIRADHTAIIKNRANGYARSPAAATATATDADDKGWRISQSPWEPFGDGAVFTTVGDLARWDANFYQPKVGGFELMRRLQTRGQLASGQQLDYAAGLFIRSYRGLPTVSHAGTWVGYQAELLRFPTKQTSVIVLCNAEGAASPARLAEQIADVVLEGVLSPAEPSSAPLPSVARSVQDLDRWVGKYRRPDRVVDVTRIESHLRIERAGSPAYDLRPVGERDFLLELPGSPGLPAVQVSFDGAPPHRTMKDSIYGAYDEEQPCFATSADQKSYVGRYRSDELDTDWQIVIAPLGRGIELRARNLRAPLYTFDKDKCASELLGDELTFQRTQHGVAGLSIFGLYFKRTPPDASHAPRVSSAPSLSGR